MLSYGNYTISYLCKYSFNVHEQTFINLNIASDIRLHFIAKISTRPQLENSVLERLEFPTDSNDFVMRSRAFSSLQRSIRHVLTHQ